MADPSAPAPRAMHSDAACGHVDVEASGFVPDRGGRVHEVGRCAGCGTSLHRLSPLDAWAPADDVVGGVDA